GCGRTPGGPPDPVHLAHRAPGRAGRGRLDQRPDRGAADRAGARMKARARIVARAQPDGTTRLVTLAGETPLLLRRAPHPDGLDTARVHLLGGASGPIGGDDLAYRVDVGPGARVQVRSVAASLA